MDCKWEMDVVHLPSYHWWCPAWIHRGRHTLFIPHTPSPSPLGKDVYLQKGCVWSSSVVECSKRPTTMMMTMATTKMTTTKMAMKRRTRKDSHVLVRTWKKDARGTNARPSRRISATSEGEGEGRDEGPKPWDLAVLPAWCVATRKRTKRNERFGTKEEADGRVARVRLLEWIAKRVYPTSKATCAPGQYYDPNADACVFVCQEGYYYDPETRSCKKVRDVQTKLRPVEQYATRSQAETKWNLRQALARALANAVLGDRFRNKNQAENCAVGFYFDPVTKACVPLCGHGYVYDKIRKECVPEDGRTQPRA